MIEYKGTVKGFLKNYPKEKRKVDEIYRITLSKGSHNYQFIGSVSSKNFKQVEVKEKHVNEVDGAELGRQEEERTLTKLKELAKKIMAAKPDENDLVAICEVVQKCSCVDDFAQEECIPPLNRLLCRMEWVQNGEVCWQILNKKDINKTIECFIDGVIDAIVRLSDVANKTKVIDMLLDKNDVDTFCRFGDEWREKAYSIMVGCKRMCGFNLKNVVRLNGLITKLGNLSTGCLNELKNLADDYTWFGETFQYYSYDVGDDVYVKRRTARALENFNEYLLVLFINYGGN